MVVSQESPLAYGHRYSTVVPGNVTGDHVTHELNGIDLAMKLHYLKFIYYFKPSKIINEELTTPVLKGPMFPLLDLYFPVAGRIRKSESGWPSIKCNDSGVRIVEAKCDKTLDGCLLEEDASRYHYLVSDKVIGPDLHFSPTVLVQFTRFKCGGIAVGLSWAHVLGDAASAISFFNLYGQLLSSNPSVKLDNLQIQQNKDHKAHMFSIDDKKPLSVKEIEAVGECWKAPTKRKMEIVSFMINEEKLKQFESKFLVQGQLAPFELISALFWKCLAKVRGGEPHLVTICRLIQSTEKTILRNDQLITTVRIDSSPTKNELFELAMALTKEEKDEKAAIEGLINKETGQPDLLLYGANLTFVDWEGLDLNSLELKGQKPVHIECSIDGVGEEGTVLVQRGKDRMVTVILDENEVSPLREVLKNDWTIA